MATTTTTPLMGLVIPVVGPLGQLGPTWAVNLNDAFNKVDLHDHSSGKGSPVSPAGLLINQDLSLNSKNLTNVNSVRFSNLSTPLSGAFDLSCVFVVGGDFYYRNAAGTSIQITAGGAINIASVGSIGGDYSATGASLNYSNATKTYSFRQGTPNTTYAAAIACGSVAVTEQVAAGNSVILSAPAGLAGSYTATLPPALPASTLPLVMSASGVLNFGEALASIVPTGVVSAFAGTAAPAGYLLCDGAAVSRATYATLFGVIGETHGEGDNVTTFNVPDYRGRFLRGVDGAATRDPNSGTRTAMATGGNTGNNVGSVQSDAFQGHYHDIDTGGGGGTIGQYAVSNNGNTADQFDTLGPITDGVNGTPRTSSETRPINAYVTYIIRT